MEQKPLAHPLTDFSFVARERELELLGTALDHSLAGRGQVRLVTGEAGAGKTTLTAEFARRAQARESELLFVVGSCNARSGIGDPYLPFREVLGQLTGDVDAKLHQGAISEENAGRLRGFLTFSGRALVDLGPDLIDIFVPGAALVTRASRMVAGEVGWRNRLQALAEDRANRPQAELPARGGSGQMEQNHIFEQFTRVMMELARHKPLVLLLDDLHWADESSASLLFHLARRIDDSRILVLGTYRPEDVAIGRGDRRHPVEPLVSELKRLHGDVVMRIGAEDETEGRRFIDALLDTRPNRLDETFRRRLHRHTRGHPLFTTELLRGMHGRGDLVIAEDGHVEIARSLDWEAVPARIEGVIEARINRIPADLQDLLTVGSVEGERFTAQVVSQVLDSNEREILQALDRDLDQHYHVVAEDEVQRVGRRRVSRYRFRHNLFQRYLYASVSRSRLELLHEDVAVALEALYEGHTEDIAALLANHFDLAGLPERAIGHYLAAGERNLRMHAADEAAGAFTRALELLAEQDEDDATRQRRLRALLALGRAQWKLGHAAESMATFVSAADSARVLGDPESLALAALGYDDPRFRFNLPVKPAIKLLEEALESLGEGDSVLRVRVICGLIRAQGHRMIPIVLKTLTEQAVAMARRLGDPQALYTALLTRSLAYPQAERLDERLALLNECCDLARRLGDEAAWLDAGVFVLDNLLAKGDIAAVDRELAVMAEVVEEVGEPFYDYCLVTKQAMRHLLAGDFDTAEQLAQKGMQCSQPMTVDNAEGVFGMQMFSIRRMRGALRQLAPVISHFVATHSDAASWRPGLALVHAEVGDTEAARREFEALAANDFAAIPRDALYPTCLSYLADVCAFLGDTERAPVLARLLAPYAGQAIVVGNSITCNGAATRSLARLAAVLGDWDEAERLFRDAVAFNESLGALPWLAHTRRQFAEMLVARGGEADRAEAARQLDEALSLARRLGMSALAEDAQNLRSRLGGTD